MFSVGEIINNHEGPGEVITRIDTDRLRLHARRATRWLVFKSRAVQWKRHVWWSLRCYMYDLRDWLSRSKWREAMKLRAINNSVLCAPNYEVQKRMSILGCDGEEIETKQFGKVSVGRTVTYENKPGQNKIAWGTVVSVGRGGAWMKDKYRLDRILREGDVIGFDTSQYVNWRDHDQNLMMLPVDAVLCRFNPGAERPEAMGVYFMSTADEEATKRFVLGKKMQDAGFILTSNQKSGEITVTDNPASKVKYSAERIVSVGAGGMTIGEGGQQALGDTRAYTSISVDGGIKRIRVKEPIEIIPEPEAIGAFAIFINTMSSDCSVKGARYRFTNWDRIKSLAFDGPEL